MKLTIRGAQRYWFHKGLISIIAARTGWDSEKVKNFLSKNEWMHFNNLEKTAAKDILDRLEQAGFEIRLQALKSDIIAAIGMPYENELANLKEGIEALSSRLSKLEELKGTTDQYQSIKQSVIYQSLETSARKVVAKSITGEPAKERTVSENTAESNIGKYWLSRIGIFTLVLGIVLFISYSFQFIGAWGKILIGAALGASLIGSGNYLALREKYRRWAMATIGGGWAILYFTVYAAYQIPVTKVISNPLIGFMLLLAVIAGSISQSLKFKSTVLVFFSYFLGFVALAMVEVSFYTLVASFLLGLSIVIVTKKMGWTWLALLGLAAVYLTHYFWLAPSLAADSIIGKENWWDALALPWAGEEWSIYPLMATDKSVFHQAFLILYWILFTAIGFFKTKEQENQNITFWLLLSNSSIFTTSYIHHLHVYYPTLKYIFPFGMGIVFLALSFMEQRLKRGLLSDLYLSFSVSLLALIIPMYFDGPWITYGWSASFVILSWLGIRHQRKVLYRIGWVLAAMVLLRLINMDYLERDVLLTVLMPVRISFLIFTTAALSLLASYGIYRVNTLTNEKEKRISENVFLIAASWALACGFLVGGLRAASSVIWVFEGIALMLLGVSHKRFSWRIAAVFFVGFAAFRLALVDCRLEFLKIFSDPKVNIRLLVSGAGILAILGLADWLRRKVKDIQHKDWVISCSITIVGALLVVRYFYDSGISSWISIIWGAAAFAFIVGGFVLKDRLYRWCGLGIFAMVLLRLFIHDFSKLETIYRIISFIGLGGVFMAASFLYSYYSKRLLTEEKH